MYILGGFNVFRISRDDGGEGEVIMLFEDFFSESFKREVCEDDG